MTTQTPERLPAVPAELDGQSHELGRLEDAVKMLEGRLVGVTRPETQPPVEKPVLLKVSQPLCPLAVQIRDRTTVLEGITARLVSLRERLEV